MSSLTRRFVLAVAGLMAGSAGRAEAGLALTFSSATAPVTFDPISAGFSFTTNTAVTVDALAYLLPGTSGGAVRLYDGSLTVLASATVLSSDPTQSTGGFTYNVRAITPVALAANTTYFVVGDFEAGRQNVLFDPIGLATDPAITYAGGVFQFGFGNPTTNLLPSSPKFQQARMRIFIVENDLRRVPFSVSGYIAINRTASDCNASASVTWWNGIRSGSADTMHVFRQRVPR